MNKFEKQLEKWNHGVLRGAQAKLAKRLGVSTATTALWATGKRHPSKGYAAKMAQLFNLDIFEISRLFDNHSSTVYIEPTQALSNGTRFLRETDAQYTAYPLRSHSPAKETFQSNSVRLPFLNHVPEKYPSYKEEDVIEWWILPRRYALGAKYIVRSRDIGLPNVKSEDDLCLVAPHAQPAEGKIVLLSNGQHKYLLRRAHITPQGVWYLSLQNTPVKTPGSPTVIGMLVRRITDL